MNIASEPKVTERPDSHQLSQQVRFQREDGTVWFGEQRMLLMQLASLANFRKEQILTVGLERAKGFFMRLGYSLGQKDAELIKRLAGNIPDDELFRTGFQLHSLKGSVRVEEQKLEIDKSSQHFYAQLVMHDAYEAEMFISELGLIDGPACWALQGHASSFASELLGQEIIFKEMQCRGCGDSKCLFEGRPAEEWEDYQTYRNYFKSAPIIEELYELQDQISVLRHKIDNSSSLGNFIGKSEGFKQVCKLASKASPGKVSVLLLGETGVGKELVAKGLHENSERSENPFIAVNCAAIPPDLIEAELFGVEKGAFTGATQSRPGRFERADKGTIFLDEVIELSPRAQAALLRVLQENELERVGDTKTRTVDVRLVAATNESLLQAVEEGRFRADLYYRLNVYPIIIPPLRERREDIPLLADHFLKKYEAFYNRKTLGLSDLAMKAILNYRWPGNVRELENVIERGLILAESGETIDAQYLFPSLNIDQGSQIISSTGALINAPELNSSTDTEDNNWLDQALDQHGSMEKIEEALLRHTIERAENNVAEAARLLGMTRPTLAYRLKKMGIEV
ncbi:sigma-54-dependent Fis family transcriptional regulator [Amphritea balenae]|uniref:Sigma-54-dependent Fis family transcriptional regulator n=1 Tax=Amphritea balenae TaxID=452629 RepID=A0A3P1SU06_9GAMM|nr:sigma-54-dependent Fis family transcriptional regulator [Amphritea balenae]RRD00682.1 sigma-54-dependent Fis family transcriptional regulator [Amphritea balenae]GGK68756.1 sigma-54-dependent Fis family transcriptional regulator [Amphritea balenae]